MYSCAERKQEIADIYRNKFNLIPECCISRDVYNGSFGIT